MHKKGRGRELIKIKNQLTESNTSQEQGIVDLYRRVVSKLESHNLLIMMQYFIEKEIIRTPYNYNIKYDIVTYGGK